MIFVKGHRGYLEVTGYPETNFFVGYYIDINTRLFFMKHVSSDPLILVIKVLICSHWNIVTVGANSIVEDTCCLTKKSCINVCYPTIKSKNL